MTPLRSLSAGLLLAAAALAQQAAALVDLPLDRPDPHWHGAVPIADGARAGAARFDGDQARIDCGPCPIDGSQPFTLIAHLRTTRGDFCTPLMARTPDRVGLSLVLGREPGRVSFEAWSWATVKLVSRSRVDDGAWHEVRACYDPATSVALLYVDGALEAWAELGQGGSPDAVLRLGNNLGAHQPFQGDLDEVRLLRAGPPAADLVLVAPVVPRSEKLAALAALRERLLPARTPSLLPDALPRWPERRAAVREHVADCLGLRPEPPRDHLDVRVHGTAPRPDGARSTLQRVSWNGFPGQRAGGWLWLPEPAPPPGTRVPAVLCPHGHWQHGAIDPVVRARCAAFASFGWIALAVDSVHVEDVAAGVSAIGVMTWHNLRALDLLRARADVDPTRIAVTGASGGGQQTYYLMALDGGPEGGLAAAAPMVMACYFREIVSDTAAHCGCNHAPGIAARTDVIELCAGFAPRPVLFGSVTGDWTQRFPEEGLPELRRLWQHLGAGDAVRSRHADEGHNYDRPMREAVYAFLGGVLAPGTDCSREPELSLYPVPVLRALAQRDPVPPPDRRALADEHSRRRGPCTLAEAAPGLPWRVLPAALEHRGAAELPWRPAVVRGPDGVPVPLRIARSEAVDPTPWTVIVAGVGSPEVLRQRPAWLAAPPRAVLVDPRFLGEWQFLAPFWRRNGLLLGCGDGYQAAHDVALVAASLPGTAPVTLVGLGEAGIVAMLAASLCPRATRVVTDDLDPDWERDGNRLPLLPGFRRAGGLAPLLATLRGRCELRLGGLGRAWQGSPHRDMLAPFSAEDLARELATAPR